MRTRLGFIWLARLLACALATACQGELRVWDKTPGQPPGSGPGSAAGDGSSPSAGSAGNSSSGDGSASTGSSGDAGAASCAEAVGPIEVEPGTLTAAWANSGEDKVTRDELRASAHPEAVQNRVWNGQRISLFGGRNEVVAFSLVLEAAGEPAADVTLALDRLDGPAGSSIRSKAVSGDGVFDWTDRNIEIFYLRYLQIKGLSVFGYAFSYDERHVPKRFRRPWSGAGQAQAGTGWSDRPDAGKWYPDIAVPLELSRAFEVPRASSQSLWVDIYIPKTAQPGAHCGTLSVLREGKTAYRIPVVLTVRDFTLPDAVQARTMIYLNYGEVNRRYLGERWPNAQTAQALSSQRIRDRHFQLAHRHRLALIDDNGGADPWGQDAPHPDWWPRLNGSLFQADKGYDGPGVGVSNGVFSIGTYGSWGWQSDGEASMRSHADRWVSWFDANAPGADYFLYLMDEPPVGQYSKLEQWSRWLNDNPGVGQKLKSFVTLPMPSAAQGIPSLDIACSAPTIGMADPWENALAHFRGVGKQAHLYAGRRPTSGTLFIEDDGVSPRVNPWIQYKKKIDRWFYWESTYYNNFQCDGSDRHTNVFQVAQTFGCDNGLDPIAGHTGFGYSNGDGVLFYPGTDSLYPQDSYGVEGPLVSVRLKQLRRGIQDVEYLTLAQAINPAAAQAIVQRMIPKVLWEIGVDNPADPTYVRTDLPWSTDPDVWEAARQDLADLIAP